MPIFLSAGKSMLLRALSSDYSDQDENHIPGMLPFDDYLMEQRELDFVFHLIWQIFQSKKDDTGVIF